MGSQLFTLTGTTVWSWPAGVTSVTIELLGGGGAGGYAAGNPSSGGGGKGGSYVRHTISKGVESQLYINVGAGGLRNASTGGNDGQPSFVDQNSVTVARAPGGTSAAIITAGSTYGTGATTVGAGQTFIGTTQYTGGNGGNANTTTVSGAGGGAAGPTGNGGNASVGTAGIRGTGTWLDGTTHNSTGVNGVSVRSAGLSAPVYGGGGSGGNTNQNTDRAGGAGAQGVVLLTWTDPIPEYTQKNYRFYADNGDETGATALAAENTSYVADLSSSDFYFHLRVQLYNNSGIAGAATDDYQIRISKNGGAYQNIGLGDVFAHNSTFLATGNVTTNRLTPSGSLEFLSGVVTETGTVSDFDLSSPFETELVFALQLDHLTLQHNDVIEFRLYRNGSPVTTYVNTPSITVSSVTTINLSGAATGTSAVSGVATKIINTSGAATGTSAVSATAQVTKNLSGSVTGEAFFTGDLYSILNVEGSITGTSTVEGLFNQTHNVEGSITGTSDVSGVGEFLKNFFGTSSGTSSVNGSGIFTKNLKGQVDGLHPVYRVHELSRQGFPFGPTDSAYARKCFQSFMGTGEYVDTLGFRVARGGNPVGTVIARLYTFTGTYGTTTYPDTLIASSAPVSMGDLSTSTSKDFYFYFDVPQFLDSGVPYVAALEYVDSTFYDASNYIVPAYNKNWVGDPLPGQSTGSPTIERMSGVYYTTLLGDFILTVALRQPVKVEGRASVVFNLTGAATGTSSVSGVAVTPSLFTYATLASLPTNDNHLSWRFTDAEEATVASNNNVRLSANSEGNNYAIQQFKFQNINNSSIINITWEGQAEFEQTPVYLQVYNQSLAAWETLDSLQTTNFTDFTLTGEITENLEDYYDAYNRVSVRVYLRGSFVAPP